MNYLLQIWNQADEALLWQETTSSPFPRLEAGDVISTLPGWNGGEGEVLWISRTDYAFSRTASIPQIVLNLHVIAGNRDGLAGGVS